MFEFWYQLAAGDTPEWRRFVVTCEDLVSTDVADDAKLTFDVVNFTGGAIDTTWINSDYTSVINSLAGIISFWQPHMDTHHRFSKIEAYRMSFKDAWVGSSPTLKISPFNLTGPPEFTQPFSSTGGGATGPMAPQVAFSVTELVPVRRSWGRFYLPFADSGGIDPTSNRWKTSLVDQVTTAVHDAYVSLAGNEFYPVIPITQSQKARVASLEQVVQIRADDVPDVIRRRRYKHALYKSTKP